MSEPIKSIAQNNYILSTQQEVSHDNTLSGNGTVESPLGVVNGYNETVLWSGDQVGSAFSITGSEPAINFQYIYILGHSNDDQPNMFNFFSDTHQLTITPSMQLSDYQFTTWGEKLMNIRVTQDCVIKPEVTKERQWGTTSYNVMNTYGIYKVVGINRKA